MSSVPLGPRTTRVSSRGYSGHHHLIRRPSSSSPGMSRLAIHPGSGRSALQLRSRKSPFPDTSPSTRLSLLWAFYPHSFYRVAYCQVGFPAAQTVNNPPAVQETHVQSLGREDPLEEGMATHFSVLAWRIPWTEEPGESHGPRSLEGCSP